MNMKTQIQVTDKYDAEFSKLKSKRYIQIRN